VGAMSIGSAIAIVTLGLRTDRRPVDSPMRFRK
jgi:hypothetical protein